MEILFLNIYKQNLLEGYIVKQNKKTMPETILITGGTGLIGRELTKILTDNCNSVIWLTREINSEVNIPQYLWNWKKQQIDYNAIEKADIIINLAGASINGKRWDENWKNEIYNSRIKSTDLIFDTLSKHRNKLKLFISASAIGYYGTITSDKIFTESDSSSNEFLAQTCSAWEN